MKEKYIICSLLSVLFIKCYLVTTIEAGLMQVERVEGSIPVTSMSPPEGNTTFLDGTMWCVAHAGVAQIDLQNALDWACGLGKSDCRPIQSGGPCFEPNNLVAHASYAFNYYYQRNGNSDVACNFGGTAILIKNDPSYEKCIFPVSGPLGSSATTCMHFPMSMWKRFALILMLLSFGRLCI